MTPREIELLAALRALVAGIDAATDVGCIDHLDCWDDAKKKWHWPLATAKALLT